MSFIYSVKFFFAFFMSKCKSITIFCQFYYCTKSLIHNSQNLNLGRNTINHDFHNNYIHLFLLFFPECCCYPMKQSLDTIKFHISIMQITRLNLGKTNLFDRYLCFTLLHFVKFYGYNTKG